MRTNCCLLVPGLSCLQVLWFHWPTVCPALCLCNQPQDTCKAETRLTKASSPCAEDFKGTHTQRTMENVCIFCPLSFLTSFVHWCSFERKKKPVHEPNGGEKVFQYWERDGCVAHISKPNFTWGKGNSSRSWELGLLSAWESTAGQSAQDPAGLPQIKGPLRIKGCLGLIDSTIREEVSGLIHVRKAWRPPGQAQVRVSQQLLTKNLYNHCHYHHLQSWTEGERPIFKF